MKQKPSFHDAIILAKTGAMIYVVDENGNKLSRGYHEITWSGNSRFKGRKGSSESTFNVDTRSEIDPWSQRLNRQIMLDDVIEHAADKRLAAFAAYLKAYDNAPQNRRVELGDINFPEIDG
jgi:hypothetical protein